MVAYLCNERLLLVYKTTWPNLADTMLSERSCTNENLPYDSMHAKLNNKQTNQW